MANELNGKTISAGVGDILAVHDGIDGSTARNVRDGAGVVTPLWMTSTKLGIGTSTPISALEIEDGLTTTGAILTLGTKETTVDANDVLGRINFYAPLEGSGGDAIAVGASIAAVAQASFTSSVNSTALYFQTGTSDVATTKMIIDEDGKVGISTLVPSQDLSVHSGDGGIIALNREDADNAIAADNALGQIIFGGDDPSDNTFQEGTKIVGSADEAWGSGACGGRLTFWTVDNTTTVLDERMRIDHDGKVGIGTVAPSYLLDAKIASGDNLFVARFENADASDPEGIIVSFSGADFTSAAITDDRAILYADSNSDNFIVYSDGGVLADEADHVSDVRLKENIVDASNKLSSVAAKVCPDS